MKTNELTGALLDYWAARAEGWRQVTDFGGPCWASTERKIEYVASWKPSIDWAQGGPILERERIATDPDGNEWYAGLYGQGDKLAISDTGTGPTPLIAAMRAYVASKFGDVVPDEPHAQVAPRADTEEPQA